ncbi:DUF4265 domain-containing protein [Thermobifida halotolerans]|uniref:DUF4265 domain-containing protein n=1 Tax=Thermobifida halotolerans TaxID=483545 RepID=UPI001F26EC3A|nr:DUF4265 domain-containing protein [Thermobifida halotolerans]
MIGENLSSKRSVQRSGWSTVHVILRDEGVEGSLEAVLSQFGCSCEKIDVFESYLAFGAPPKAGCGELRKVLLYFEESGGIEFKESFISDGYLGQIPG